MTADPEVRRWAEHKASLRKVEASLWEREFLEGLPQEVIATHPPTMGVQVHGRYFAVHLGNPTHPRIDLVFELDGEIRIRPGIVAASPVPPILPPRAKALAHVHVGPWASIIQQHDIKKVGP